jgi:hypothetical protein
MAARSRGMYPASIIRTCVLGTDEGLVMGATTDREGARGNTKRF